MYVAGSGASNSPRPSSASSNASSRSGRKSARSRGVRPDVGPRPNEDICISEEVKIGINLAVERFRMNEGQKVLEFPSSLTATERAYVHQMGVDFGFKHKSRGKGAGRYITLTKKDTTSSKLRKPTVLQLVKNSRQQIQSLLQRFPVTNKERLELVPRTDKAQVNEVSKELARTATGRLNNGVSQVPPMRGESDLDSFRQTLPIYQYREEILEAIGRSQVTLVSGETGSGKTTQVPQLILDHCHTTKQPCRIFCTQPRRIAALSIAERVALERGEKIGQTVGYQIRLESRVSPKTLLTFCTNGVLLRTLMGNEEALSTVTHVIVDEVHERDKFCDFLLISVREVARRQPNIKIILMSAALNTQLFERYFQDCPVVSVPGSLFPVEEYYLEDVLKWITDAGIPSSLTKSEANELVLTCNQNLCLEQKIRKTCVPDTP